MVTMIRQQSSIIVKENFPLICNLLAVSIYIMIMVAVSCLETISLILAIAIKGVYSAAIGVTQ